MFRIANRESDQLRDRDARLGRWVDEQREVQIQGFYLNGAELPQNGNELIHTWNIESSAASASFFIADRSSRSPHCDGPTVSAIAMASARSPRENAERRAGPSSGVNFEMAYRNARGASHRSRVPSTASDPEESQYLGPFSNVQDHNHRISKQ